MLDHHLQRSIVYRLALSPDELRFSELKPGTIDNKLFTYHLKKVVTAGLVAKDNNRMYSLTPEGRRLGMRVLDSQQVLVDRADSVLFLAVRRAGDAAWLLYRRKVHPLINQVGFMHATPTANEDSAMTAARTLQASTGLKASFAPLGGGYFRVYQGEGLESFTHFTLLVSSDAVGELQQNDSFAEYFWVSEPDFSDNTMLPNMQTLVDLCQRGEPFFIEETFRL